MKEAGESLKVKEPKPIVFEDKDFHSTEKISSIDFGMCFFLCLTVPLRFLFLLCILIYSGLLHLNFRK